MHHANTNKKKAGVPIFVPMLISNRKGFKVRKVIMYNNGHCIVINASVLQDDLLVLNVHIPNNSASK